MFEDKTSFSGRLIILGVVSIALLACLVAYATRSNQFAPYSNTSSPALTNPEILQNWLPPTVYKQTIDRINNYLRTNDIHAKSMTVKGDVSLVDGMYEFSMALDTQQQPYKIDVLVRNFSGIISTAISVNGTQLSYQVPTTNNGTTFSGIDILINEGVTAAQASKLQQALQTFATGASQVAINQGSIVTAPVDPNKPSLVTTYKFRVDVDNKHYDAELDCTGLTTIQLFLRDTTGKQVFDSGQLT